MKAFSCRVCDQQLYVENSRCVSCGTQLGYSRAEHDIVPLGPDGTYVDAGGVTWHRCVNVLLSACTWLAPREGGQCFSCDLTRTRPADADLLGLSLFPGAEAAKRRLVMELDARRVPITPRWEDRETGLCFDLLSSVHENVVIGHENGVITIDLAEEDQAHRAKVQVQLDEPYRTMLGHFRHEVGHYAELMMVTGERIEQARELFGDETVSYSGEIDRHYAQGPPDGWENSYISTYATMHPFEDFAETFAHWMHISETIDTARAQGLLTVDPDAFGSFRDLVRGVWVPLSTALNQINRAMGADDLYPFVIPDPVLDKLEFVASLPPRP
ncbi:putative zinc-binding metallopeptidase [Aeromicrobium sp. CF4.19]|uniref:zinc-binding metallopeptidase family protein n=1 Tax=Aeromicrobium sp. CF4.19 TaxID=3373082 RepID=UPI003EE525D1